MALKSMLRDRSLHPLSRQHHNGLALVVMTERALARDCGAESIERECKRSVDRFDLELKNHFGLEEELLFPAIEAALGPQKMVARLIGEHRRMEAQVARIREAPERATLEEFLALLRQHIRTEENELFEDIQKRLPAGVLDAVGPAIKERAIEVCLE
jgi:hemerythrin-like domain-containing protein